jgi:hypothetical protein
VYERHDPFAQALHQVVRENLATFYAAIEEGWQTGLPQFVRAEFRGTSTAASCNEASPTLRAKIADCLVWSPSPVPVVVSAPRA